MIIFRHIKKLLITQDYTSVFFQVLFLCFAYFLFPENFKLVSVLTVLIIFLLNLINKDIFLTTFLVYLVNLLFLKPGKYFSFLMIEGKALGFEPLRYIGLIEAYGITISDILAFLLGLFLFRKAINLLLNKQKIKVNWFDKLVFISFFLYFSITYYSSRFFSFNFIFSLTHLLQYSKLFLTYVFTSYLIKKYKKGSAFLSYSILGLVVFNLAVAFGQFFLGFASIGSVQKELFSYHLPEEESLFIRPFGVLLHSNQLGFLILTWITCLSIINKIRKKYKNLLLFLTSVLLVITQSRTIIILLIPIFLYSLFLIYKKKNYKLNLSVINKKSISFLFVLFFLIIILGQRFLSSRFSFQGGSAEIRLRMYKDGLSALSESYLFGFGPATNVKVIYELIPDSYIKDFPYAIHNGYLQMSLESGIIAVFFFFLPFFSFLFLNLKYRKNWLFSYLIMSILVYYIFQPYAGRIEFPFLGMFLAFINFCDSRYEKNSS